MRYYKNVHIQESIYIHLASERTVHRYTLMVERSAERTRALQH